MFNPVVVYGSKHSLSMPPEECRQGQMNFVREGMERWYRSIGVWSMESCSCGEVINEMFQRGFFRTPRSRMLERNTPRDGREKAEDKLCLLPHPA